MDEHPNYEPGGFRGFRERLSNLEEGIIQHFADNMDDVIASMLEGSQPETEDAKDAAEEAASFDDEPEPDN